MKTDLINIEDLTPEQKSRIAKSVRDLHACQGIIVTVDEESCCRWLVGMANQMIIHSNQKSGKKAE